MKIKSEHLQHLKQEIDKVLEKYNKDNQLVNEYQIGSFHNSNDVKDIQKRFCFDIMYGAGLQSFVCKTLYTYLNDDHIYTALKKVCPKVKRLY